MQGIFSSNVSNQPAVVVTGNNGAEGIKATSDGITVIQAISEARTAVLGGTTSGIGVIGRSLGTGIGILADSDSGTAVNAISKSGVAISASSDSNFAILGQCSGYSFGVVGVAPNSGVAAFNPNNDHAAYLASDCCAAWFTGDVTVTGAFFKAGGGFRIDHPLQPANKYLSHSFVESTDMKNIYDGEVVADASGAAVVVLPQWFEALNHQFRYQLTPIGAPAPDLHIRDEVKNHRFTIAGAKAGMRVSWQVTGVRQDEWANRNRIAVEEDKQANERGYFLHPQLQGMEEDKGIAEVRHPRPSN